jgi:hypothetical protein
VAIEEKPRLASARLTEKMMLRKKLSNKVWLKNIFVPLF